MSAIDFKRAFDSLSLDLLFKSLELFGTVFNCILKIYAETFQLDWEKVHSLFFKLTLDTKLREFQYKILHRICYTNVTLFKFGLSKTPLCYFCNEELETLEHFLFHCETLSGMSLTLFLNRKTQSQPTSTLRIFYLAIFAGMMMTVFLLIILFSRVNIFIFCSKYIIPLDQPFICKCKKHTKQYVSL